MFTNLAKIVCKENERARVAKAMSEGAQNMPGCSLYAISFDDADSNAIWVFEAWTSAAHHAESLKLESVQKAMTTARPYIMGAESVFKGESYSLISDA